MIDLHPHSLPGRAGAVLPGFDREGFSTRSLDAAHEYISRYVTNHLIDSRGPRRQVDFDCQRWGVGDIQVCNFSYGAFETQVRVGNSDNAGFFLVMPLTGRSDVRRNRRCSSLLPGTAMVFRSDEDSVFANSAHFRNINLRVSMESLARFVAEELGVTAHTPIEFAEQSVATSGEIRCLVDYIRWVSAQLDSGVAQPFRHGRHLARHAYDMLLALLLTTVPNNYQERFRSNQGRPAAPAYVRRAEDYMQVHACEPLAVSDVARAVGIATRTLHLGFQRSRSYSVGEYLRNARLELARSELLTARERNLTVTDVALACGFGHMSKFARAYQRRFGEKPSDTLRRGR